MSDLIISIIGGVISGVIASYIFLIGYLKNKRPKIKISDYINKSEYKGEINYFFKFVNATNVEIFDVHIEPTFYKPVGEFGGTNLVGTDIELVDNFAAYIPAQKAIDNYNLHAMRIRTTKDLEKEWTDESSFIRLTIIAKHSLSGLNKVFYKDFLSKDCITHKKFQSGNDLGVK